MNSNTDVLTIANVADNQLGSGERWLCQTYHRGIAWYNCLFNNKLIHQLDCLKTVLRPIEPTAVDANLSCASYISAIDDGNSQMGWFGWLVGMLALQQICLIFNKSA